MDYQFFGGEPLHPKNIEGSTLLAKRFRETYKSTKDIWLWTGFLFDQVKDKIAGVIINQIKHKSGSKYYYYDRYYQ